MKPLTAELWLAVWELSDLTSGILRNRELLGGEVKAKTVGGGRALGWLRLDGKLALSPPQTVPSYWAAAVITAAQTVLGRE